MLNQAQISYFILNSIIFILFNFSNYSQIILKNRVYFCNPRSVLNFNVTHFSISPSSSTTSQFTFFIFPEKSKKLLEILHGWHKWFLRLYAKFRKNPWPTRSYIQYMSKRGSLAENSAKPVSIGFIPTYIA